MLATANPFRVALPENPMIRLQPFVASALILTLPALAGPPAVPTLYGLQNGFGVPADHRLLTIDPVTAEITSAVQVVVPGFELTGSVGLARQPGTGTLFVLERGFQPKGAAAPNTMLGTIDPATGIVSVIGTMDDRFSSITFLPDGRLFAATGDGAAAPESLYEINPITAEATRRGFMGNGNDGEALGATPDGSIYHASGNVEGEEFFERLDLQGSGAVTDILLSHTYEYENEALALAWSSDLGQLFLTNRDNDLYTIDRATGAQTLVGHTGLYLKGIAFDGATLYGVENAFGGGGGIAIHTLNPATGAVVSSVPVTSAGFNTVGMTGLARDPVSGLLYVVLRDDFGARALATLNPASGEATVVGLLADSFAGLAFRADGTLVGVTGDGATIPESLFRIDTATAQSTILTSLGDGEDGEAIAIAGDGFLYHTSGITFGDQYFQRVDIDLVIANPFITDIGDGTHSFDYEEAMALAWSTGLNAMYLTDILGDMYTIDTATGATTLVGRLADPVAGAAPRTVIRGLTFVEDISVCTGDTNGDGVVDFIDLNNVLSSFGIALGQPGYISGADVNHDDVVDFLDLNIVLSFFGQTC